MKLPDMPDGWTIRELHEEEVRQLKRCPVSGVLCSGASCTVNCLGTCASSCGGDCVASCSASCVASCGGSSSA